MAVLLAELGILEENFGGELHEGEQLETDAEADFETDARGSDVVFAVVIDIPLFAKAVHHVVVEGSTDAHAEFAFGRRLGLLVIAVVLDGNLGGFLVVAFPLVVCLGVVADTSLRLGRFGLFLDGITG